jgi:hypothetical protein
MKSLIFTLICLPVCLFGQTNWRVNFTIEQNVLHSFDSNNQNNPLYANAVELSAGSGYLQGICYLKRSNRVGEKSNNISIIGLFVLSHHRAYSRTRRFL